MYREYCTRRFLSALLGPPLAAVLVAKGFCGEGVLRTWDFVQSDPAQWEWHFPGLDVHKTEDGAEYVAAEKGLGLRLDAVDTPAVAFRRVKACVRLRNMVTGQEIPAQLVLSWARALNVDAGGPAPERMCLFQERQTTGSRSGCLFHEYVAEPAAAPGGKWNNTIRSMVITVNPANPAPAGFRVCVAAVQFLK